MKIAVPSRPLVILLIAPIHSDSLGNYNLIQNMIKKIEMRIQNMIKNKKKTEMRCKLAASDTQELNLIPEENHDRFLHFAESPQLGFVLRVSAAW